MDVGFKTAMDYPLSVDTGRVFENIVFLEWKRKTDSIFYYRNKQEMDFYYILGCSMKYRNFRGHSFVALRRCSLATLMTVAECNETTASEARRAEGCPEQMRRNAEMFRFAQHDGTLLEPVLNGCEAKP